MIKRRESSFIWDPVKEQRNIQKHGVDFTEAARAFKDPELTIITDPNHSAEEKRYFCLGKVKEKVLTVRFVYRHGKIRIIGAGFWRKGAQIYAKEKERRNRR